MNSLATEKRDFLKAPLPLAPEFLRNLRLLGRRPTLQQINENLIKKYGTHFLVSATLGGKEGLQVTHTPFILGLLKCRDPPKIESYSFEVSEELQPVLVAFSRKKCLVECSTHYSTCNIKPRLFSTVTFHSSFPLMSIACGYRSSTKYKRD